MRRTKKAPPLFTPKVIARSKADRSIREAVKRINIWEGSVRSGKTIASILRWLYFVGVEAPGEGSLIMTGKTNKTLERNVINPIISMVGHREASYSRGAGEFYLYDRLIDIVGANDERSQEKIRGATVAGCYGDEITLWPESFFKMMLSRLSVRGSKFFGTTNPDSPYHWLKREYLDRARQLNLGSWHFKLDDNPFLARSYVKAIKAEYTGLWYMRFIDGLWVQAEGSVYDMWDEAKHVMDVQAMLQAQAADGKRREPRFNSYFVAVDYGTNNPCTFGLFGYDRKPPVYLVKEYYYDSAEARRQKTDSQYGDDFMGFIEGVPPGPIYVDPSALSFIAELRHRGLSTRVKEARNDVLPGIRFVGSLLSNGEFFVDKGCTKAIEEFSSYVWDANAQKRGLDVPIKSHDHCFAAGTMVETRRGGVPIENITTTDEVLTRDGYKRVLACSMTSDAAEVADYELPGGSILRSTASHPIYTKDGGFIPISALTGGNTILTMDRQWVVQHPPIGTRKGIEPVFNLTVEGSPEFFANGVLVHNCMDRTRYGLFTRLYSQLGLQF